MKTQHTDSYFMGCRHRDQTQSYSDGDERAVQCRWLENRKVVNQNRQRKLQQKRSSDLDKMSVLGHGGKVQRNGSFLLENIQEKEKDTQELILSTLLLYFGWLFFSTSHPLIYD